MLYKISVFHIYVILNVSFNLFSQEFTPEITNYTKNQYVSDKQNWGIDVNDEGIVFVANNSGLLIYNGQKWQKYYLPNKTVIRSVLCVDNRIYTGSYEEFGYWIKDNFGTYHYTSLVPKLDNLNQISGQQFWQIFNHEEKIFFKSYSRGVYVYNGTHLKYIENSYETYDFCSHDGEVLFANTDKGILKYDHGTLTSFKFLDTISSFTSVNNFAVQGEKTFFYDLLKGGFLFDKKLQTITRLPENLNTYLKVNILNRSTFISENKLVLGTIKDGIAIYDLTLKSFQVINKSSGLQNNTVLGLKNHNNSLWISLDNGISKIDFNSTINFYTENSGSLGTVYDIAFTKNDYYLGSNTGFFILSKDNQIQLIEGLEGHVWDITALDDELLIGHNNGFFVYERGKQIKKIDETGVFCSVKVPNIENAYLQGTYYGIHYLIKENDNWKSFNIEGFPFLVDKIVFESQYIIWVSHPHQGLYRIELDKDYTKIVNSTYYGDYKDFGKNKTKVYEIDRTILFYNSNQWYQFYKDGDSIGYSSKFQSFKDKDLIANENEEKWFINRQNNQISKYINSSNCESFEINSIEVKSRIVSNYEKIISKNDSIQLLNLIDGFAMFNSNNLKNIKLPVIDKIYSKQQHFDSNNYNLTIPYEDAQFLSFEVYSPEQYSNNHAYELSGEINQAAIVEGGKFTLQNLRHGKYLLSVVSTKFENGEGTELKLEVLPPWYLSSKYKILYSILFAGVIVGFIGLHKNNLRKHQRKINEKCAKTIKDKISTLKRENLERELKIKTKELVGFAEANVEKNEIIMILSNELDRTQHGDINKSRVNSVLQVSKDHLKYNREWNVFKKNFDELNSQFLEKLIEEFPTLTTRDLRLCAYIKTGLTSKDIAPLLGISVRGVEHHRNRLRKKLKLNSGINLSSFLVYCVTEK